MKINKNFKLLKFLKYLPVLSLCCFSLLGIGFSTWAFFYPGVNQTSINVIASGTTPLDMFSITNISTFVLGPDGIVKDETIVSTGNITITFEICNDVAAKGFISTDNVFSFYTKLHSSKSAFLTNCITTTPTIDLSGANVEGNSTSGTDVLSNKITCSITDTTADSKTVINVTYLVGNEIAPFYNNLPVLSFELEAIEQ